MSARSGWCHARAEAWSHERCWKPGCPCPCHEATEAPAPDVDPMTACDSRLDFDEWWFGCQLDGGHPGWHKAECQGTETSSAYVVRWASQPEMVVGEVSA